MVAANLLTVPMLLIWPSPVAVILPKVLSAPVWLIGMRRLRPWAPDAAAGRAPPRPFVGYGAAILGVEVVKALRLQAFGVTEPTSGTDTAALKTSSFFSKRQDFAAFKPLAANF